MKILIATGLYPPEIGGPATYAHMLETHLPARGIEVKVVPFGWVRHYPKIIRHIVFAWKLRKEAKDFDFIYALDPISVGVPAAIVAKLCKKRFLIRLGGDYAWEQGRVRFGLKCTLDEYLEDMKAAPLPVRMLAWLQTKVSETALDVVVPSKYLKSVVVRWGIKPENVQVIYSALYPLEVKQTRDELRRSFDFKTPTIVSAGRLVPWKGFKALIEVVAQIKKDFPEITLVIAGDGEDRLMLEKRAAELNISNNVRFVGSITKETLGAIIKAGDLFVLNTAYEGLSHQLLEVMDLSVPIVTTNAGGNPELITDKIHGRLISYNNAEELREAIVTTIANHDTSERYVVAARGRAKDFVKDKVVDEFVELVSSYG